jgi:hypothetical protein
MQSIETYAASRGGEAPTLASDSQGFRIARNVEK